DALNSSYGSQITGQKYSGWARERAEVKMQSMGLEPVEFQQKYNQMTSQISKLLLVVFILIYSFGVAAVNVGKGKLFYFHV
ncbi:MAG: hypothetical protein ACPF9D_13470, partial [Owenweeksia sp.]